MNEEKKKSFEICCVVNEKKCFFVETFFVFCFGFQKNIFIKINRRILTKKNHRHFYCIFFNLFVF